MAVIRIIDPNNSPNDQTNQSGTFGGLSNEQPILWPAILSGGLILLIIDESGSFNTAPVKDLFDLSEPPSFPNKFNVSGTLDGNTEVLSLFLSPTDGDTTFPFVDLQSFKATAQKGADTNGMVIAGGGSGTLFRPNTLPKDISWDIFP
jgi:hypothetical protein